MVAGNAQLFLTYGVLYKCLVLYQRLYATGLMTELPTNSYKEHTAWLLNRLKEACSTFCRADGVQMKA